jgi:hypothetical protein
VGQPLWDFAYASFVNLWGLCSAISTLAWIVGLVFRRRSVGGTMSAADRSMWHHWPTALIIVGWAGSLLFIWLGCFQAWKEKNDALIALTHPPITMGEIHKEPADKKPDVYINIDIDIPAQGVIGAVPQLVSICQIKNNICDNNLSFNYNRQIGWRKGTTSNLPVDINGTEQIVPIIIKKGHAFVYFIGKNDGEVEHDAGCKWCDDIPVGKYRFQVQIKANNSFATGYYIFDWLGKVDTSNVLKTSSGG